MKRKIKFNLLMLDAVVIVVAAVLGIHIIHSNAKEQDIAESTKIVTDTSFEIKNCPFCGSHATLTESDIYGYDAEIRCDKCGINVNASIWCNSKEEAREYVLSRWNKRVENK